MQIDGVQFCSQCGKAASGLHEQCAANATLSPPRFCAYCGRRMKVQVSPLSWLAICSEHGESQG
ncbi:MAG: hypothetical protein WC005_11510 [Candidatus Nanopelagicales bacterium]